MPREDQRKGKAIFIAYRMPPIGGSRAIRLANFAEYLTEFSWELDILTIDPTPEFSCYDESLQDGLQKDGITIFRTYPGLLHRLGIFSSKKSFRRIRMNNGGYLSRLLQGILKLLKRLHSIEWYPFATWQGMKMLQRQQYDLIFSASSPFVCHLVGATLKKLSHLPSVVEYGDPWLHTPHRGYNKLSFQLRRQLEEVVLQNAEKVIVTTEATKRLYLKEYGFLKDDAVEVLTSGFDPKDFTVGFNDRVDKDEFRIVYTGSIYGVRDIKPFLMALDRFIHSNRAAGKEIEFYCVGRIEDVESLTLMKKLRDVVKLTGFLPFMEALSFAKSADVLLLIGNTGGVQIPGKVFTYFGVKRPILTILGGKDDPLSGLGDGILKKRGLVVDNDVDAIEKAIQDLFLLHEQGRLDETFDLTDASEFHWDNIVKALDAILLEAMDAHRDR